MSLNGSAGERKDTSPDGSGRSYMARASVLVVDDDARVARYVRTLMESFGCGNVVTASGSAEVLSLMGDRDIDLLLMDINLNERLDGIDVVRAVRERWNPAVIYITGHFDTGIIEKAKKTNPAGYIIKPFDPNLLRANVEIVLENRITRQENERLRNAIIQAIEAMQKTIELKDPYTSDHQLRVAKLARELAREMGLTDHQVEGVYYSSLIHEYGKIFVPSEILSKPGRLSENQFNFIIDHPVKGYEVLAKIEFPWPVADIILQHHERMDGSGYPRKLKGEDIMMEARVIAVADVISSMTSYKPYRHAIGIRESLEELERNRGTLYDPRVVDSCLTLFRLKNFSF